MVEGMPTTDPPCRHPDARVCGARWSQHAASQLPLSRNAFPHQLAHRAAAADESAASTQSPPTYSRPACARQLLLAPRFRSADWKTRLVTRQRVRIRKTYEGPGIALFGSPALFMRHDSATACEPANICSGGREVGGMQMSLVVAVAMLRVSRQRTSPQTRRRSPPSTTPSHHSLPSPTCWDI